MFWVVSGNTPRERENNFAELFKHMHELILERERLFFLIMKIRSPFYKIFHAFIANNTFFFMSLPYNYTIFQHIYDMPSPRIHPCPNNILKMYKKIIIKNLLFFLEFQKWKREGERQIYDNLILCDHRLYSIFIHLRE